jgi:hypothetical protein
MAAGSTRPQSSAICPPHDSAFGSGFAGGFFDTPLRDGSE